MTAVQFLMVVTPEAGRQTDIHTDRHADNHLEQLSCAKLDKLSAPSTMYLERVALALPLWVASSTSKLSSSYT